MRCTARFFKIKNALTAHFFNPLFTTGPSALSPPDLPAIHRHAPPLYFVPSVTRMKPFSQQIQDKLSRLPDQPGVYIMRDRRGRVIYIGKAASLRNRVRHYFQPATLRKADPKLRGLIRSIEDLDFMPLKTEAEAAITESQFIKDYKPRYNILLKDDKRFPLLKIDTHHPLPVIAACRLQKKDDASYFGPYTNSTATRAAKDFLERRFGLRPCTPLHPTPEHYKHCINDIIRYCSAPCIGKISEQEYRHRVEEACAFLRGERPEILKEIRAAMEQESAKMNFEKAAALRDLLTLLHRVTHERAKARKSAAIHRDDAAAGIRLLQDALQLPALPRIIETFDISNISGTLAVASMVCCVNGIPDKKRYRHFRIKTIEGPDDPGMMAETIRRRYTRLLDEHAPLPDLVLVDGGITQVRAARAELNLLGLSALRVAGLAKRFEELIPDDDSSPLRFPPDSHALQVLQQIRDEAHRFAITYHRTLRAKRIRESEIDDIPGIGEKRKQALLRHFGSVIRLKRATADDIARVPGFGPDTARLVLDYLAATPPNPPAR